jgi:hypothetical protein
MRCGVPGLFCSGIVRCGGATLVRNTQLSVVMLVSRDGLEAVLVLWDPHPASRMTVCDTTECRTLNAVHRYSHLVEQTNRS